MSLVALMVVRNEAHRYLQAVLCRLRDQVDRIVVFDDQSDDDSVDIAGRCGAVVFRNERWTRFAEHEGRFRTAAWSMLERADLCAPGDFVLSIDADELLMATEVQLKQILDEMDVLQARSAIFDVWELWELDPPMVRRDRWWGNIRVPRLFRWQPGAEFPDRMLGCGSAPTFVQGKPAMSVLGGDVGILHLGYVDREDRKAKHAMYAASLGRVEPGKPAQPGHSHQHVASILDKPTLREWSGPPIEVWRGVL